MKYILTASDIYCWKLWWSYSKFIVVHNNFIKISHQFGEFFIPQSSAGTNPNNLKGGPGKIFDNYHVNKPILCVFEEIFPNFFQDGCKRGGGPDPRSAPGVWNIIPCTSCICTIRFQFGVLVVGLIVLTLQYQWISQWGGHGCTIWWL